MKAIACPNCKQPVGVVVVHRQWRMAFHDNTRGTYCRGSGCKAAMAMRRMRQAQQTEVFA